ncbi:PAS domain S-box protein, partial [Patulibacter sp. S7RM1-6]
MPAPVLTDREREVLTQVALGRTGQAIAADLFLSPATVESHVSHALAKLDARNRPHAVALALRDGELDPAVFAPPRAPDEPDASAPPDLRQVSIDALPEPVAIVGADGTVLAVNATWTAMAREHGAGSAAGPGAGYLDVCDRAPQDAIGAAEVGWGLREILDDRCATFVTEYAFEIDGVLRWFEARMSRYRGDGPARAVVRHHDVTERHARETDVRLARSVLDETETALVVLTTGGIVEGWRAGAPAMFGHAASGAEGRALRSLVVDPIDVPVFDAGLAAVQRQGHWAGELCLRRRDGGPFDAHVRLGLLRDEHGVVGVFVAIQDVTARVGAQRALLALRDRLRAVASAVEEGLVTLDAAGTVVDVNPAAVRLLGWPAEELRGRSFDATTRPPDVAAPVLSPDGRVERGSDELLLRRDGTPVTVDWTLAPFDAGAGASGAVLVLRDAAVRGDDPLRR